MSHRVEITAAGNVLVPAYLALRARGYRVSRELIGKEQTEFWVAVKSGERFSAEDPLALLGLVALHETRGAIWQAADEEIDAFFEQFP